MKFETGKREWNRNYLVLLSVILVLLIIVYFLPGVFLFANPTFCPHYRILGIECPLCGLSRAVSCFLHLRFANAWNFNFNVYFLALLLPVICLRIFNNSSLIRQFERILLICLGSGLILIYVFRIVSFFQK